MKNRKKRFLAGLLALMMVVAMVPGAFAAEKAKTVTMTAYHEVIKDGSTVYCVGYSGLYKVKLKKGKPVSKKRLDSRCGGWMKKKGGYIYYVATPSGGLWSELRRVKISTAKGKKLVGDDCDLHYVIKGEKIYYRMVDEYGRTTKKVMKLNGKSKKKTSVKAVTKTKQTNAKGYSVKSSESGDYMKDYLKTPKGKLYLGKAMWD